MNEFENFGISQRLIDALNKENILEPTDIQRKAIPELLNGFDVIGGSKTGTGKTFAYSIPMVEKLVGDGSVEALILCPTRELSIQVQGEIEKLISKSKIKCVAIYGGESYIIQDKKLKQKPSIIVGTPGRIIDQMNKGHISFNNVKYLVLDEADEMLKMGFSEDLETILKDVPSDRQTALFSATLPQFIKNLALKYMKDPKKIEIESKTLTVDLIDQRLYYCMKDSKMDLLIRLLDYYEFNHMIIFCNTKSMVDELTNFLKKNDYKAEGLHGDLKQLSRDKVMNQFRDNIVKILIATDVAARGIDISDIDCVLNYDIPYENEIYVHRIGRTARIGHTGMAISIATNHSKGRIKELEQYTKSTIKECEIPTIEEIKNNSSKKLYLDICEAVEKNKDNNSYDKLLMSLARRSTDPMPLLRGLLSLINKDEKVYNEIKVYQKKERTKSKDTKSKSKKSSKEHGNKNFQIEVNLGSVDKIRPNQLVMLFHDQLKVHREHFGKIVINKTRTIIDVNGEALRFFKENKNIKFNGKTANIRIL